MPKELQYSMFTDIKSIIELASSHQKIIISPLPRYLNARCCGDADHVSNLEEEGYRRNLVEAVLACRKNLRDFAFRLGIRNLTVACPWSQLRNSTLYSQYLGGSGPLECGGVLTPCQADSQNHQTKQRYGPRRRQRRQWRWRWRQP